MDRENKNEAILPEFKTAARSIGYVFEKYFKLLYKQKYEC